MATAVSQSVLSRWQTLVRYFGPCVATLPRRGTFPCSSRRNLSIGAANLSQHVGLPFKCILRSELNDKETRPIFNSTRRARTGRLPKEHPTTNFGFYYKGRQHRNIAMPLPFGTEPTFASGRFATLPPAIRPGAKSKNTKGTKRSRTSIPLPAKPGVARPLGISRHHFEAICPSSLGALHRLDL